MIAQLGDPFDFLRRHHQQQLLYQIDNRCLVINSHRPRDSPPTGDPPHLPSLPHTRYTLIFVVVTAGLPISYVTASSSSSLPPTRAARPYLSPQLIVIQPFLMVVSGANSTSSRLPHHWYHRSHACIILPPVIATTISNVFSYLC